MADYVNRFEELVSKYRPDMVRRARRVLHDWGLAEEATQAALWTMRNWTLPVSDDDGRRLFLSIVTKKARTLSHQEHATGRAEKSAHQADEEAVPSREDEMVAEEVHLERITRVHEALACLNPLDAQLAWLAFGYGRPWSEVAEQYGLPPSTVRWRLRRAKKRLSVLLADVAGKGRPNPPLKDYPWRLKG